MTEKDIKEIRKMLEAIEGFNCREECENCVKNGFTCLTFDVAKDLYQAGCRLNGTIKGENHE